jgi:hypothetical protein
MQIAPLPVNHTGMHGEDMATAVAWYRPSLGCYLIDGHVRFTDAGPNVGPGSAGPAIRRQPILGPLPLGRGLSFGLIHSRSRQFTIDRRLPVRAGQGRWRPVVDAGAQYSKACEGASLPWVQSHLHRH